MAKLTKTEARILARMDQHHAGRFVTAWCSGHGADGGRVFTGKREYLACLKLIERGLARKVSQHAHQHYNHGWCVHVSEIAIGKPEIV